MSAPDWEKRAACRGEDLYLFFGHEGERQPDREAREQVATAICARCSVRTPCLLAAFERKDDSGVWGGLGEEERRSKRRSWLKRNAFERKTVGVYVPLRADKRCPACDTAKPAIDFPKDRRQPDGLNRICKGCANEAGRRARAQRREAAEQVA